MERLMSALFALLAFACTNIQRKSQSGDWSAVVASPAEVMLEGRLP